MYASSCIGFFLLAQSVTAACKEGANSCNKPSSPPDLMLIQQYSSRLDRSAAQELRIPPVARQLHQRNRRLQADLYDASRDPSPLIGRYHPINNRSTYDLGGFKCGQKQPTVNIWYPVHGNNDTQPVPGHYPIACYGHSLTGKMVPNLIRAVVSLGFIVVAPATSGGVCDYHYQDMLHAIEGSKHAVFKHEALQYVDWSRTAVFGHSMGAYHAMLAASSEADVKRLNIKAVAATHGDWDDPSPAVNITIPGMFVSAGYAVRKQYKLSRGRPKISAALLHDSHVEASITGELNPYMAHFLGCHVADLHASCDKVYGQSVDSLCRANQMAYCETVDVGEPQKCEDEQPEGKCQAWNATGLCHERRQRLECQRTCDFGCSML